MVKQSVITRARKELKKYVEPEYRDAERRFFKEKIKNYGVRTPNRRKVARKLFKEIKDWNKEKVFEVGERLLMGGYSEEATIAFSWVYGIRDKYEKKDFKVFESWVKKYVDNWSKCDDFCTHAVGHLVNNYPELTEKLISWTESKNRWVRRAAAVTLIYPVNKPKNLKIVFKVAEKLLMDEDEMVQKGYGWMLKEASKPHQKEVFKFVMKHKDKMPRTALRYAIELMPKSLKRKAMAR